MILLWTIRYLDRSTKDFGDRVLYLDTKTLDPANTAAIEFTVESKTTRTDREILKYRPLFIEGGWGGIGERDEWESFTTVGPVEYFEDEAGNERSGDELVQLLSGSQTARLIPHGANQHDIDFMMSERTPLPLDGVVLSQQEVQMLAYFIRDLRELRGSAFMKDGPGTLKMGSSPMLTADSNPMLETAVTDDEIRSFVTIFRRLYLQGKREFANFVKVCPIVVRALEGHPLGDWVSGAVAEYQRNLESRPRTLPQLSDLCIFSTGLLVDVFLYTRFVHQPNADRERQFKECLVQLHGKHDVLTWLFLTEIRRLSSEIKSVGQVIERWFNCYCEHHGIKPDIVGTLVDDHPGLGVIEKQEDKRNRLFDEKAEQLARAMWEASGQPAGGPADFLIDARSRLASQVEGTQSRRGG